MRNINRILPIGASVSLNASGWAPFPLNTNNYFTAADYLKSLGLDSIEVHIRAPEMLDGKAFRDHCDKIGLLISTIGTGQGYTTDGLSITSTDTGIRQAAVDRLKHQLELGKALGCPIVIGSMRGTVGNDRSYSEVDALMTESMKELAEEAERLEVSIVIEAIDRFETDYLNTAAEVLALIDKVGSDRVLVHLDTYHMNLEEQHWTDPIIACKGRLGHIHIADNRRYYPGWGLIDFKPIIKALIETDYSGTLTLECYPYPSSEEALLQGRNYLDQIMEEISMEYQNND